MQMNPNRCMEMTFHSKIFGLFLCFATLWGEIGDFGALYLLKKVIMENTATNSPSRRGKSLKFDQEWKDAVDRLPKHYRDEICAAIEAYQRDLTTTESSSGKSTLEKLLSHKHSRRNRKKHRRHQ